LFWNPEAYFDGGHFNGEKQFELAPTSCGRWRAIILTNEITKGLEDKINGFVGCDCTLECPASAFPLAPLSPHRNPQVSLKIPLPWLRGQDKALLIRAQHG
jgi:hypothetical protein